MLENGMCVLLWKRLKLAYCRAPCPTKGPPTKPPCVNIDLYTKLTSVARFTQYCPKKNNSNFQSFGELFIYWWCALLNAGHSMQCNFGSVSTVKLAIHPFFNTCLFPLSGLRGVSSSLSQLSVYLKTKLYYLSAMNLRMKCTVDLSLSICRSNHASWLPSWL